MPAYEQQSGDHAEPDQKQKSVVLGDRHRAGDKVGIADLKEKEQTLVGTIATFERLRYTDFPHENHHRTRHRGHADLDQAPEIE